MIKIKRVYEPAAKDDGRRVLVDRLWPRGLTKEKARVDEWIKEVGPSNELRKWFGHDPEKWGQFKKRYFAELRSKGENVKHIRQEAKNGDVTLVFGARHAEHSNAAALKEFIEKSKRAK